MDYFSYKDGKLFCEDVDLQKVAIECGTPCYVYSKKTLERHINVYKKSFKTKDNLICFSVKSLSNISILKLINDMGCGFDVVSGGELRRALHIGANPQKIIFSGVGKSYDEILMGVHNKILSFNIESESELHRIEKIASSEKKVADVSIRFNPEVDSGGHEYIKTGRKGDKFGISSEETILKIANYIYSSSHLRLVGLACHIGSQILDLQSYKSTARNIKELSLKIKEIGNKLEFLDLGGGLGIPYDKDETPSPENLISIIEEELKDVDEKIILEPGRSISGNAGILLTMVEYIKDEFLIIDAAMNDLLRPALYNAKHDVWSLTESYSNNKKWTIVGPVCESSDIIAKDHVINADEGDILAIKSAGAYGFVMASNYNSRMRPPEVLVDGNKFNIIRARESFDDLIKSEVKVSD
ncbi:MAG: diaminopimelate decarboxylase [Gammaproteobacteria bacterium]|tara:strand:+ start:12115 stop:13353 length:1239 start_codon:yes stop_codon:yes gene_type:complete